MEPKEIKELKEMEDFIKAFLKLEAQIHNPSREGMIDALKEALAVAQSEIRNVEVNHNEMTPTPWDQISDEVLYNKLNEYLQGMRQHAVEKFGEEEFKRLLEQNVQ